MPESHVPSFSDLRLTDQVISSLSQEVPWTDAAELATRLWIQHGGAQAAFLATPESLSALCLCDARRSAIRDAAISFRSVPHGPAAVVAPQAASDLLQQLSPDGPSLVRVWPELATVLLVRPETSSGEIRATESLIRLTRLILRNATDRPIVLPDAQRLESMAEFAAGAGHEINNPLGSILGQTQLLLRSGVTTEQRQALETIGAQAWRIRDMIGNTMLFARPPQPKRQPVDIPTLVENAVRPLTAAAEQARCRIVTEAPPSLPSFNADPNQLQILISSLVQNSLNAIHSSGTGTRVCIRVAPQTIHAASISVLDDGPGLTSPSVRRHLFDPFFSGRAAGRGLGFGLCLAWQIVRMHHGCLFHQAPASGGAAFHAILPLTAEAT